MMHRTVWAGIVPMMMLVLVGCGSNGPKLYKVVGKVTMDGKPLKNAEVRFLPIPHGKERVRPSSAITDENGNYLLEYSSRRKGALPGEYQVYISTKRKALPEIPAVQESVPDIYNSKSKLKAEIDDTTRKFDFDLVSTEGKVAVEVKAPGQPATSDQ